MRALGTFCHGSVSPVYRKGGAFAGDMCQPVKFVGCGGKITVIFSNAAGQQHYEVATVTTQLIQALLLAVLM